MTEDAQRRLVFLLLALSLPAALVLGITFGSVYLPPSAVARSLLAAVGIPFEGAPPLSAPGESILWSARVPRVLLAALVGGGLAVVGAALQSLFRNPMADSGLLGVGPGAALGAVLAVNLGWAQRFLALPLAAFAGAMLAVLAVYLLSHAGGRPSLHGLLLTGLAVSALAGAGTSVLLVATEEFRVRTVLFWFAGGLDGRGPEHLRVGAIFMLSGCVAPLGARPAARRACPWAKTRRRALSLPVHATRMAVFVLAALVAGPATALAGSVPFVGLVAPHALRPLVGSLARRLLPASFLAGAILVVVADLVARTASERMDLPLGSITAFVGAPYFLFALRGQEGRS